MRTSLRLLVATALLTTFACDDDGDEVRDAGRDSRPNVDALDAPRSDGSPDASPPETPLPEPTDTTSAEVLPETTQPPDMGVDDTMPEAPVDMAPPVDIAPPVDGGDLAPPADMAPPVDMGSQDIAVEAPAPEAGPDVPAIVSGPPTSNAGACPTLTATTELQGTISSDQTWSGVIAVTGALKVTTARITVATGTSIILAPGASIEFGASGAATTVSARGTEASHIRICAKSADVSQGWSSVIFSATVKPDTILEHVRMSEGGIGAPVLHLKAPITINTLTLDSNAIGMRVEGAGFLPGSSKLTISHTRGPWPDGWPAVVDPDAAVTIPRDSSFVGNMYQEIYLAGGTYRAKGALARLSTMYMYRIGGNILTAGDASLTIEPGTFIVTQPAFRLEIGADGGPATIIAAGTGARPIVFESAGSAWHGVVVAASASSASVFRYAHFNRAGSNMSGAALTLRRPVSVTYSRFVNVYGYGIRRANDDENDYLTTNSFEQCTLGPVGPLP